MLIKKSPKIKDIRVKTNKFPSSAVPVTFTMSTFSPSPIVSLRWGSTVLLVLCTTVQHYTTIHPSPPALQPALAGVDYLAPSPNVPRAHDFVSIFSSPSPLSSPPPAPLHSPHNPSPPSLLSISPLLPFTTSPPPMHCSGQGTFPHLLNLF